MAKRAMRALGWRNVAEVAFWADMLLLGLKRRDLDAFFRRRPLWLLRLRPGIFLSMEFEQEMNQEVRDRRTTMAFLCLTTLHPRTPPLFPAGSAKHC